MKRWHWFLVVSCVAGFFAGMAWPPPPIPAAREDTVDWAPPPAALMSRYSPDVFAQARSVRWQADRGGTGEPDDATAVSWRLAGLLENPEAHAIVLESGPGQVASTLEPGATLPDGSLLVEIVGNTITVESGDCRRTYKMHYRQPIQSSGSCGPSDTDL